MMWTATFHVLFTRTDFVFRRSGVLLFLNHRDTMSYWNFVSRTLCPITVLKKKKVQYCTHTYWEISSLTQWQTDFASASGIIPQYNFYFTGLRSYSVPELGRPLKKLHNIITLQEARCIKSGRKWNETGGGNKSCWLSVAASVHGWNICLWD